MHGDGIRKRRDRHSQWWITWTEIDPRTDKKRRYHKKADRQSFEGAKLELTKKLQRLREAKATGFVPKTFREVETGYLEFQKVRLRSQNEYERQLGILMDHLRPFFAGKLDAITRRDIERYITTRSQKVSPGTVRKEVGVLKHLLNFAVDSGMLSANPAFRVKLPKPPAGRVRYLQPGEFQAVLGHCPPWIKPIVQLAVATGMRRGEILGLRWMDVDLMNRCINLPQTKNGEGRTVYLNKLAMDVFSSLDLDMDMQPEQPVFALDVEPEELSMCFMRACRQAGIRDFRFHDLRHTHASWLRQSGVPLDLIAKQLGHKDLRMTQRYAHLHESQVRDAVSSLDKILSIPESIPSRELLPREAKTTLVN
jgi:integrase